MKQQVITGRKALLAATAASQTERSFAQEVVDYADRRRWLVYRTYDSRRSPAGYPDLTMARDHRLVFAELKSARGKLTEAQEQWLRLLRGLACSWEYGRPLPEVYVWRPAEWDEIMTTLE